MIGVDLSQEEITVFGIPLRKMTRSDYSGFAGVGRDAYIGEKELEDGSGVIYIFEPFGNNEDESPTFIEFYADKEGEPTIERSWKLIFENDYSGHNTERYED